MSFKEIIGQNKAILFLQSVYRHNKLSHAYCFVGPDGVGKSKVALNFAKLLLCENPKDESGCDVCPSCRKAEGASHPDLQRVSPDGAFIKIDAVREACRRLNMQGFESARKVLIVDEAHALNDESSNALLKTLEEPSKNTIIILVVRSLKNILPTIASRCQRVIFSALNENEVKDFLVKNHSVSLLEAQYLSFLCDGSLGVALRYHNCMLFEKKNRVIDTALNIGAPLKDFLDPDSTEETLLILSGWFRDILRAKAGGGSKHVFINHDRQDDIIKNAGSFSFPEIEERLNVIADTQAQLKRNANVRLALAKMRVDLWK